MVGVIFLVELVLVVTTYTLDPALLNLPAAAESQVGITNTAQLGSVIYTKYVYFFQLSGLVLLVAMIGAIVLTLRDRPGVKRQDAAKQAARTRETSIEIRKVKNREGV